MFYNFMYFTGCCRAALAEVNYSLLCDLIEREKKKKGGREGEKAEEEKGRKDNRRISIHSQQ